MTKKLKAAREATMSLVEAEYSVKGENVKRVVGGEVPEVVLERLEKGSGKLSDMLAQIAAVKQASNEMFTEMITATGVADSGADVGGDDDDADDGDGDDDDDGQGMAALFYLEYCGIHVIRVSHSLMRRIRRPFGQEAEERTQRVMRVM